MRGSDDQHFCQPTAVAVARTGEIVVADGYCNNRIMIFDPSGNLINKIPQQGGEYSKIYINDTLRSFFCK